jgi:hypothetical protein
VVTNSSRPGAAARAARAAVPSVVHPTGASMGDCVRCHVPGRDDLPPSHGTFGAATCLTCHRVAPAAGARAAEGSGGTDAGPVPHPVTVPHDDCVGCHAIGGNRSMPADHSEATNGDCADCHSAPAAK